MTQSAERLLADVLSGAAPPIGLSMRDWDLLVRQARHADMLARIAADCADARTLESLPRQPRMHLESAAVVCARQHRELRWEVRQIDEALASIDVPLVLLKGAAYALAELKAGRGRRMSDVDILVPRSALPEVESTLMKRGWVSSATSAYEQRYYRTWMHELPPMRHLHRGAVIDVHHAILPITARSHPSSDKLLATAVAIDEKGRVKTLSAVDMVLHSATHLFHEGELEQGFRGLVDIDSLLRELATKTGFWDELVPRAVELELSRSLFYALRYVGAMLHTPIPDNVLRQCQAAPGAPGAATCWFMDKVFLRALRPFHATTADRWTSAAHGFLYLRGHWLRMPPHLLVIHLGRKLLLRMKASEQETEAV